MSHCKLFQTIKREGRASSCKKPAQFCQYSSVDEAILFSGYVELSGLGVRMAGYSNQVHGKLATAYGLLINFEL